MKIKFENSQSRIKPRKFGPYKKIRFMYEWLIGDDEEIALFDKHRSGMWQLKEDDSRWTGMTIEQ